MAFGRGDVVAGLRTNDGAAFSRTSAISAGTGQMLGTKTRRFHSRQLEIEAMRFDGSNAGDIAGWLGPALCERTMNPSSSLPTLLITTPEGSRRAEVGDWVVKSQDGAAYSLKPFTFDAKFEPVSED